MLSDHAKVEVGRTYPIRKNAKPLEEESTMAIDITRKKQFMNGRFQVKAILNDKLEGILITGKQLGNPLPKNLKTFMTQDILVGFPCQECTMNSTTKHGLRKHMGKRHKDKK